LDVDPERSRSRVDVLTVQNASLAIMADVVDEESVAHADHAARALPLTALVARGGRDIY